jgi:uncharacterized membrane protein (UPF0127 family)
MKKIILLLIILSFKSSYSFNKREIKLHLPSGKSLQATLAITAKEHQLGLSGIYKKDFKTTQGLLFVYKTLQDRQFWMPHTFFNLDIFFLNKDFQITNLERNLKAHPTKTISRSIAKTQTYKAHYVLEIRSDSPLAKELKIGTKLKWSPKNFLQEIKLNTRLLQ